MALGFMPSYAHLIKHRSDFALAHAYHLIPEQVKWTEWCQFIQYFRDLDDTQVAKRYHYGQMRLSRLNWAVRLFQPPSATTVWFYDIPNWSIGTYVQRIAKPLIFGFASISLALASMQVLVSITAEDLGWGAIGIRAMCRAIWVFSIAVLFLSGIVWLLMFVIPMAVLVWQVSWGFKHRDKQHTARMDTELS
ncbi:hypothetical protein BDV25DRAFT_120907 [Aspergillus avenaceus]|uniref:Uncharacterized protein n=1 Tax=Aspergillus avenaceus TaxID=36643 RepID=A0A5N6TU04_ASPAV|nr:hypothetical protein BDV25DRAFT_120907 [Aspergillus avenaceus]